MAPSRCPRPWRLPGLAGDGGGWPYHGYYQIRVWLSNDGGGSVLAARWRRGGSGGSPSSSMAHFVPTLQVCGDGLDGLLAGSSVAAALLVAALGCWQLVSVLHGSKRRLYDGCWGLLRWRLEGCSEVHFLFFSSAMLACSVLRCRHGGGAGMHLPSQDIHVDDPTQAGYVTLMNWMHGRDVTRADGNLFRDIPITSDSTGFRRINLIHAGRPTVSLIIDERDVYLIAFRRGDGRWLHFWDRVLPKVPGPDGQPMEVIGVPIQLRSSYLQLMKEKEKAYFSVGKHVLVNIYFILLNYDTTVALDSPLMNKQRKALTQLLVMICEASQFNPIYDLVLDAMGKDESTPLYMGIWEWIKNWSTLSEFALHCKGGRIGCQRCCSGPWHGCASCYLFGGEWR